MNKEVILMYDKVKKYSKDILLSITLGQKLAEKSKKDHIKQLHQQFLCYYKKQIKIKQTNKKPIGINSAHNKVLPNAPNAINNIKIFNLKE